MSLVLVACLASGAPMGLCQAEEPYWSGPLPEPVSPNLTKIRYSHYWPPLGGTNCARFVDGECVSHCANGQPWQGWVDKGCACPPEWEFGTKVILRGEEWTCVDRGGKVKYVNGIPWVDFLTPYGAYPPSVIVLVEVVKPFILREVNPLYLRGEIE